MRKETKKCPCCIVLSGGQAKRMQGQDKGLVNYHGRPLIEHVLERVRPQVNQVIISANRHIERYATYSDQVVADLDTGFYGPLSGLASCLPSCRGNLALVVACDMPNLPTDLSKRLSNAILNHEIAIASCDSHLQLALMLKVNLLDSIKATLADGEFRFLEWVNRHDTVAVEYTNKSAFININSLGDLDTRC